MRVLVLVGCCLGVASGLILTCLLFWVCVVRLVFHSVLGFWGGSVYFAFMVV